jgi:pyridoxal phosphate enzyme (YggS family)
LNSGTGDGTQAGLGAAPGPTGDHAARLAAVLDRIERAAAAAGRPAGSIRLLAVSKTFGPDVIRALAHAGQLAFGENYWQEAAAKIADLAADPPLDRRAALEWHFIGPIQSNKTRPIAEAVDWVQTVDRERIATRLSDQRQSWRGERPGRPPLAVLLQVNVSGEPSKSGCDPGAARALAEKVAMLPGLALRGLMAIPAATEDEARQRAAFAAVRELHRRIADDLQRPEFDVLSMGMSADLEAAIAEGSTLVRVGTALFGTRPGRGPG